ncbi:hypothetical protein [Paraburkholderia sp. BCC1884]|uniref:hypothetical protein n=1 Tax=Paraburkholderia sp. BCC1884 TaxID=2562668 RepID=UPI0011834DDB|nr:hypothetical protein [Paraburkholderia sp. BCC1884]
MSLYVVYFRGPGPMPAEDVQRIREHAGVQVVNDKSKKALLLDLDEPETDFLQHVAEMGGWAASKQTAYQLY